MTKPQKIWFGIFLAMFLIPEILWGLLNTLLFGAIFNGTGPSNFSLLPALKSNGLNRVVICVEFIGILFSTIICLFLYYPKKIFLRIIIIAILIILLLLTFYILLFSFNFNPQIG